MNVVDAVSSIVLRFDGLKEAISDYLEVPVAEIEEIEMDENTGAVTITLIGPK